VIQAASTLDLLAVGTAVTVYAPGEGAIELSSAGAGPRAKVGRVRASTARVRRRAPAFRTVRKTVASAGPVTFKLKLSSTTAKAYKRQHRLTLAVQEIFTPRRGKPITRTRTLTLVAPTKPKTLEQLLRESCQKNPRLRKTAGCRGLRH
jgi:hypothetical protein